MPLRKQPQTIGRTLSAAEVTLSIGEVAAAVGVPAGMLRRWGREGLLAPPRSRGGHRTFRAADVARAHRIAELREEGLNAAAIERELGSIERGDSHAGPTDGRRLGRKLRALRERKGWTLKTVADDAAVSLSFLSALERGQTGYSMENLFRLAEALGTTLPELSGAPGHRAGVPFVRPREREQYVSTSGDHVVENLMSRPGSLEVVLTTIAPGASSDESYSHGGQEFLFLLSGRLKFWVESECFELTRGASLHFSSAREHRWYNPGRQPARVIWVNAPSEGTASAGRRRLGRKM